MNTINTPVKKEPFFFYYAWVILAIVVFCFGGKAVFDADGLPPITNLHHFHAVAMLSWFVLFAVQPTLIHHGKYKLHRLLGKLSILVVVTFIGFGIAISLYNWGRTGRVLIITANTLNLTLFVSFYLMAIKWRKVADTHKRLMLYATLFLMGPAIGRLPEIFNLSPYYSVPILIALQLLPILHDKRVHGKVHRVCWLGFLAFFVTIPIIVGLSESLAWKLVLENILGPAGGVQVP
jgi:hypothetical protein